MHNNQYRHIVAAFDAAAATAAAAAAAATTAGVGITIAGGWVGGRGVVAVRTRESYYI